MSLTQPLRLVLYLLSSVFMVLGGFFLIDPQPAATFYGLQTSDPAALFYVRAVGLRDLALATYLLGLTLAGQRRALSVVLTGTILIPVGDILLLVASGTGQIAHYLLHGGSLACFTLLALWSRVATPTP